MCSIFSQFHGGEINSNSNSKQYLERVDFVKKKVWDTFHVNCDQVLQGRGTSNTGNVAKRCLAKAEEFAEVLGVNKKLIENFSTILCLFSLKREKIDIDALQKLYK